ncbi:MAG: BolA family transcriptional regulator [Rhodospirillaceae bacterium]|nr:BolA family transcriptional regulator [Rhodospirillaceae bacterium]
MRIHNALKEKLTTAFAPTSLEIIDNSAKHAGHSGAHPEGESHFKVIIVSNLFDGKSRVERQRMVFDVIKDEMSGHIHAMELKTMTPAEAEK